jgi:hypothetical protein
MLCCLMVMQEYLADSSPCAGVDFVEATRMTLIHPSALRRAAE